MIIEILAGIGAGIIILLTARHIHTRHQDRKTRKQLKDTGFFDDIAEIKRRQNERDIAEIGRHQEVINELKAAGFFDTVEQEIAEIERRRETTNSDPPHRRK